MAVDGSVYWGVGYWAQGWWETGYWASEDFAPVQRMALYGRVTLAPALDVRTVLLDPAVCGTLTLEPPYA